MSMADYEQLKADHNDFAKDADGQEGLERDLTAYGLFGLQDPLRPEIVGSIQ
jgi:magnesium-transporting ATPase (P-type)